MKHQMILSPKPPLRPLLVSQCLTCRTKMYMAPSNMACTAPTNMILRSFTITSTASEIVGPSLLSLGATFCSKGREFRIESKGFMSESVLALARRNVLQRGIV